MFKRLKNLDFIGLKKYTFILSVTLLLLGFLTWILRGGFNFSIDFEGGSQLQISLGTKQSVNEIKAILGDKIEVTELGDTGKEFWIQSTLGKEIDWAEIQNITRNKILKPLRENFANLSMREELVYEESGVSFIVDLGETVQVEELEKFLGQGIQVQAQGPNTFFIRSSLSQLWAKKKVIEPLREVFPNLEIENDTTYDPTVGQNIRNQAWVVSFLVLCLILLYIGLRFQFKFGVAAIVALVHDALMVFSFLLFFNRELDISIVVALLTILGYSLNDTIVVFDRIRENQALLSKTNYILVVNESIGQSLSRTVVTSLTTLFVVLCVFFLGGPALNNLAFALLVGVLVGTYSSIFVASPILVLWEDWVHKRESSPKRKKSLQKI